MDKKNINDINSGTDNSEEPVLENKNENTELSNEPVALEEFSQSPTAESHDDSVIEEQPEEPLDSDIITKNEPAAYAFRWDYNEQKRYDDESGKKNKSSKGVLVYAIILTITFLLSIAVLIGALLFGDYLV